jgi:predicted nuclease of restriction endonuclease-like (RecB) superfamily
MLINDSRYVTILEDIKLRIKQAQYRAILCVNRELIELYWYIGKTIIDNTKYGSKFVENLSKDIRQEFPNIKGFSVRNLKYMHKFAVFVDDEEKVQTLSALLSWSHNILLFDKVKTIDEYVWYVKQTIENGWSLSSLEYHLKKNTYIRQEITETTSNYERTLPSPFSDLAKDTIRNPYLFDFVEEREGIIEREIEHELVLNIAKTILELGSGFAFVGNQYHIEVSNKDYYIDLLFYHTKLRCYVVIELKNTEFKPEYAGKLNFYLTSINQILKHESDNPSIGILLCKSGDY